MAAPNNQPSMELPEDLEPIFSNIVRISHTPTEVVLDFTRFLPGQARMKVLSRLVMSPLAAKLLLRALAENVSRYEAAFGEIRVPVDSSLASDLFRRIHPPEPPPDAEPKQE